MRFFILEHTDALMLLVMGAVFGFLASRPASKAGEGPLMRQIGFRMLRWVGPGMVALGLLRLYVEIISPSQWYRFSTNDGVASAEFPGAPASADSPQAGSTQRLAYQIPSKQIWLTLSYGPLPLGAFPAEDSRRLDALSASLTQTGATIVAAETTLCGAYPCYCLDAQKNGGTIHIWFRTIIVGNQMYRIIATSEGTFHDDPIIKQFLQSFHVSRTGA